MDKTGEVCRVSYLLQRAGTSAGTTSRLWERARGFGPSSSSLTTAGIRFPCYIARSFQRVVTAVVICSALLNSLSEYWEENILASRALTSYPLRKSRLHFSFGTVLLLSLESFLLWRTYLLIYVTGEVYPTLSLHILVLDFYFHWIKSVPCFKVDFRQMWKVAGKWVTRCRKREQHANLWLCLLSFVLGSETEFITPTWGEGSK